MPERAFADEYRERLLSVDAWRHSADALISSAAFFDDEIYRFQRSGELPRTKWKPLNDEIASIYFMLFAFAIENLLKAHIVHANREEISAALESKGRLPEILREHDIYELACRAGFEQLVIDNELVVHRLSRSAIWYGRYPAPLREELLDLGRDSPNLAPYRAGVAGYSGDDFDRMKAIAETLRSALPAA